MSASIPERQLRQNIRLSPYLASIGGSLTVILGFWTPFYLSYLVLAAVFAHIAFFILWLGVRRGVNFGPFLIILTVFSLIVGRDLLLPHDIARGTSFRCELQFVSVWVFFVAALHIVFRAKLKGDSKSSAG